jgi:hypothetical protein
MAATVSVFGYTIPLTVILVFIALVVGLALVVLFWLTVVWSVYRSVQSTRRERVREDLQNRLLDGVFDPETEWGPWVESLSKTEREVVEDLLDEYLRELDGGNAERLRELGDELGVPERSVKRLRKRGEYGRLRALTWLTLLEHPEKLTASEFSPETPRERAAVARLRYECDDFETPRDGISLLLSGATTQFSVFGQDTLYRIGIDDPQVLFEVSAANYEGWSEPLLVQVLTVCRHVGTNVTTENLSWLIPVLEHESEAVRASAALALGNVGWRSDVRDDPFLDRLLEDPSPNVRAGVYRMLARWGDEQALATLSGALLDEDDQHARLVGTNALVTRREQPPDQISAELDQTWRWSHEHAAYDSAARRRTTGVGD